MTTHSLRTRFAQSDADILAAQKLRYSVFSADFGATGETFDTQQRVEADAFDPYARHLLLEDESRPDGDKLVGLYRLMTAEDAENSGGFYSENEFDLTRLKAGNLRLLELGRTCVHPEYRNGVALSLLWAALARFVEENTIDVLFGAASFVGTEPQDWAHSLTCLHQSYLSSDALRVTAKGPTAISLDQLQGEVVDRKLAMQKMPPLIKSYLRLGGTVGQGGYVDHGFNTIDVCLLLDTGSVTRQAKSMLTALGRK